jgi:hypothetical protein
MGYRSVKRAKDLSDFAFASFPGAGPFHQCIAVSTSADPAGTYTLYALQHDPTIDLLGDYPKFAMWNARTLKNADCELDLSFIDGVWSGRGFVWSGSNRLRKFSGQLLDSF